MSQSPQSLKRASSGEWVTLRTASVQEDRFLCRLDEFDSLTGVIRRGFDPQYGPHIQTLMETPPPDTLGFVRWTWPIDLLTDAQGRVHGYVVDRESALRTTSLANMVDAKRRLAAAPQATGRHLLLVAKNVAVAVAALHSVGYGRVRGRQMLIDEQTRILMVRVDELLTHITEAEQIDDERRLGALIHRMIAGHAWSEETVELRTALRRTKRGESLTAQQWFTCLREAERALPHGGMGDIAIAEEQR